MLKRKILSDNGNPSKPFIFSELGIIPVKFIINRKRANFLKYILNESKDTMIRQVYEALKVDSKKGDFFSLVTKDTRDLEISLSEEEIQSCSKGQ